MCFPSNMDGAFEFSSNQHHLKDTFVTGFLTSSTGILRKLPIRQNCICTIYWCPSYLKTTLLAGDSCHRGTEKNPLPPSLQLFIGPHEVYNAQSKNGLKATRAGGILLFLKSQKHNFLSCGMMHWKEPSSKIMKKMTF